MKEYPVSRISDPESDLPEDVVLSVRNVSKKFCRNLRRSMWYGIQDLSKNLVGFRSNPETLDSRPWTLDSEGKGRTLDPGGEAASQESLKSNQLR